MIVTYIRSSSWGSHDFCPMKYFLTYGLGHQEPPNPKTIIGTMVHKYMEILGKIKKTIQDGQNIYDDDIVGQINVYDYQELPIIDAVYEHYYQTSDHHKDRIKRLSTGGFCPENFDLIFRKDYCQKDFFIKRKFQDGIPSEFPKLAQTLKELTKNTELLSNAELISLYKEADYQKYRLWIDRALSYNNGQFDPRKSTIVDAEIGFDIEIYQPWAMYDYDGLKGFLALKGTIDQVNKINENTYEIVDYKGLPLDTPIPTPNGWTTMGNIAVGDIIFDQYGKQCSVIGKSQIKYKKCYNIFFDDQTSVMCDDEHLWKLSNGEVIDVKELKVGDKINICGPLECQEIADSSTNYFRGSIQQRLSKLSKICSSNKQALTTHDPEDHNNLKTLLRTLGKKFTTNIKLGIYRHTYEIILHDETYRTIIKIEEAKERETQCIAVDSKDNTYLCTEYLIPTHNTGARLNWATGEEKTLEKLQHDPQLRLYHYVCHRLFPHIENVFVTIFFMNDGGAFTLCFTKKDLIETENMIMTKFEDIKNTERPAQNKSWKCKSFCHFGRHSFKGTNIQPIIEFRPGQMAEIGQPMTMCDQTAYCLQHRPMDSVMKNMSKEGFSIDFYKKPGT